ncbi:MAG TPA: efflux RND transporter periplasmic adaptor subunit [Candidatus Kapabacteria bacterium]|nr:efflux RND transporter periplasmic adaptor subunit [Candidatus Kapabacteria bacterium]
MSQFKTSGLIFIFALSMFLYSCDKEPKTIEEKKKALNELKIKFSELDQKIKALEKEVGDSNGEDLPVNVTTETIKPETFRRFLNVQGKVESEKLAMLSTTMGGKIVKINSTDGAYVKKGTVILEIESDILRKSLNELENSYEFVKKIYQKQSNLYEQKAISEVQYLEAKNNKESLELKIETVKRQLADTKIVAPFDGTIDRIMPKLGELASPGLPLVQLSGGGSLKLIANVSETYINSFKVGTPALVTMPELNAEFNTKISVISKAIDNGNRTFRVELVSGGLPATSRPNMLCNIKFNDISIADSKVVPLSALQKSSEGYYLYVVEGGSKPVAKKKFVTVANVADSYALISSGLEFNDQIINDGVLDVSDGQQLIIKQ